jgi:hypothetical protein
MQPKRSSNVNKQGKSKAETPLASDCGERSIDQQPDQAQGSGTGSPPTPDEIRQLAYEKWEAAGKPPGDGTDFWLQAEKELLDRDRIAEHAADL